MTPQPVRLSLTPDGRLMIAWDDGQCRVYAIDELRENCPCAACQSLGADLALARSLPPAEPPLAIRQVDPVGNYAYRIVFSDGHDTGLFTLDRLRGLGREAAP